MPRKRKYATEEARQEARKEQLRANVRRFRAKRRAARDAGNSLQVNVPEDAEVIEFGRTSAAGLARNESPLSWMSMALQSSDDFRQPTSGQKKLLEAAMGGLPSSPSTQLLGRRPRAVDGGNISVRTKKHKSFPDHDDLRLIAAKLAILNTPHDISSATNLAPIDTSFQVLQLILSDFSGLHTDYPWLKAITDLRTPDRFLEIFATAIGLQWIGRVISDKQMVKASYPAYQRALQMLRTRMLQSDLKNAQDAAIMITANIAIIGMELAETQGLSLDWQGAYDKTDVRSDERGSWNAKTFGIARSPDIFDVGDFKPHFLAGRNILELAGPAAFSSDLGLQIYRSQRGRSVFLAMYEKTACFLESHNWQTVPYQHYGMNWEDRLWEIVVKIPGIIARTDKLTQERMSSQDMTTEAERRTAVGVLHEDMQEIQTAFEKWLTQEGRDLYHLEVDATNDLGGVIRVRNLEEGEGITCYWFYNMIFATCVLKVQAFLFPPPHPSPTPLITPSDLDIYAYNVLRCVSSILPLRSLNDPGYMTHVSMTVRTTRAYLATDLTRHKRAVDWCDITMTKAREMGMGWVSEAVVYAFWKPERAGARSVEAVWDRLLGKKVKQEVVDEWEGAGSRVADINEQDMAMDVDAAQQPLQRHEQVTSEGVTQPTTTRPLPSSDTAQPQGDSGHLPRGKRRLTDHEQTLEAVRKEVMQDKVLDVEVNDFSAITDAYSPYDDNPGLETGMLEAVLSESATSYDDEQLRGADYEALRVMETDMEYPSWGEMLE